MSAETHDVTCMALPPDFDVILPGIYISNLSAAQSPQILSAIRITHILSVCPDYPSTGVRHLTIPVEDTEYEDLLIHFTEACAFIQSALDHGGRVLVHCRVGISRSATVVAAYLMKTKHLSSSAALRFIRQRRPQICPNYGFVKQLSVFAECGYDPSPTNTVYVSWRQRQNKTITGFLNHIHDTIPILKDKLYLSSDFPEDKEQGDYVLVELGITHLLTLTPSKIYHVPTGISHLHTDGASNLIPSLHKTSQFIEFALRSQGRVLVHCSTEWIACVAVTAYFMKCKNMSLSQARKTLEDALPLFNAPVSYTRHLEEFAVSKTCSTPLPTRSPTLPLSSITATAAAMLSETGIDLAAFGETLSAIQKSNSVAIQV